MRAFLPLLPLLSAALLAGCSAFSLPAQKKDAAADAALYLEKTDFSALPGWREDDAAESLSALRLSCARILKKDPSDAFSAQGFAGAAAAWQAPCAALPEDGSPAQDWFEAHFIPYALSGAEGDAGLFTGYYEPLLRGSRERKAPYLVPLHARPAGLVTADLGAFLPELAGRTVTGRVAGEEFVPYFTRAEIESGALPAGEEIVWVDDAVDAFFLHIQGSGLVEMEDGTILRLGYAAQNGHAYTAIGRALIDRGALTKEEVSMQSIRAWLAANPAAAGEVMNLNASYVFFRALEGDGPLGGEGVALTPGRSLAVDRRRLPYGAPVFIDAENPQDPALPRLRRLMIAQDTGGAIRGAVRGDVFWGAGAAAAEIAGRMKSPGKAWILLPRGLSAPETLRPPAAWRKLPVFRKFLGLA